MRHHLRLLAALLLGALIFAACGDGGAGMSGDHSTKAKGVTFSHGPKAAGGAPSDAAGYEEYGEFTYHDLIYNVTVTWWDIAGVGSSPCTVDGALRSVPFSVRIADNDGRPYDGPAKLELEPLLDGAQAFLAVGDACASAFDVDAWSGQEFSGTVSYDINEPGDLPLLGGIGLRSGIGLRLKVRVPGTDDIVVVPGVSQPSKPLHPGAPQVGDHLHLAYGIFVCDEYLPAFHDAREDLFGIHTHGDGLIDVHPFTQLMTGEQATLGVFLNMVGIALADDALTLPEGTQMNNGDDCGGGEGQLRVLRWKGRDDPTPEKLTKDLVDIGLGTDGVVLAIVFAPRDADVGRPRWEANLADPQRAERGEEPLVK